MNVEDKPFFAEDGPTQRLVLVAVRRENVLFDETFNDDIGVDELASLVHGLLGVYLGTTVPKGPLQDLLANLTPSCFLDALGCVWTCLDPSRYVWIHPDT